jgi:tetratricopeptide (TPR) repeat protein
LNREFEGAIELYEKCLTINSKNPSTYLSLGFTYHLTAKFKQALDCYHKASFLKNEDSFMEELVAKVLNDINDFKIDEIYDF